MSASTRLKSTWNFQIYHRDEVTGDKVQHDVPTIDTVALQVIGGGVDFELDSSAAATYLNESLLAVAEADGSPGTMVRSADGSTNCDMLYIRHSGFTSSSKTTRSESILKWNNGYGGSVISAYTVLNPGEAAMQHGMPVGNNKPIQTQVAVLSGTDDIWVELIFHY